MELSDRFLGMYELCIQEMRVLYLKWTLKWMKPPSVRYMHLFLWENQKDFCAINSRYGRAFGHSFGSGVRNVGKSELKGDPPRGAEMANDIKTKLTRMTGHIREATREALKAKDYAMAGATVQDFFTVKLLAHELLFDQIHLRVNTNGESIRGKWLLDESDRWTTLDGIRNRIINSVRFGELLELPYVKRLNKELPGFSPGSTSTFIRSGMVWQRWALCSYDCGPVLWSKRKFVHFKQIKKRMNELGWPYQGTPYEILKPFYHIALDYKRPPLRLRGEPEEGYSLSSLRKRREEITKVLDRVLVDIERARKRIMD